MRAWRTSEGWLVELGRSPEPVLSTLTDELPLGPWKEPHDFVLVGADGVVRNRFAVSTWSVEDELGMSAHAVVNGAFVELTIGVFTSASRRVTRSERTLLGDLRDVPPDDAASRERIDDALTRDRRQAEFKEDERKREARARVAAIPGATEDFGAGEAFRRAQEALLWRVESYGQALDRELLLVLVRFGVLHRSLGTLPPFSSALEAFVTACRLAAFDRSLNAGNAVSPAGALPATGRPELRALGETLGELERRLLQEAEGQEWSDAHHNASQFRNAAAQVARARDFLREPASP